jgi:hypothetical protein
LGMPFCKRPEYLPPIQFIDCPLFSGVLPKPSTFDHPL